MSNLHQCNRCGQRAYECGYYDHGNNELCENFTMPLDNSRMFSHWYSIKGRIGRLEYILTFIIAFVLYFFISFIIGMWLFPAGLLPESPGGLILLNLLCMAPSLYLLIVAGIKRAHDSGVSWWYSLAVVALLFVINIFTIVLGIAGCVFLFKDKGEEGINEFGSNPSEPYHQQIQLQMEEEL